MPAFSHGGVRKDASVLSAAHFCTSDFDSREQYEAWRSLHRGTIELLSTRGASAGPAEEFASWRLGDSVLTRVVYSGVSGRRWRHHPKSYLDHSCLVLVRTASADGSISEQLSVGSVALSFEGQAGDSEVITLYTPREQRPADDRPFEGAHGLHIRRDMAPLLAGYMDALARQLPHVSAEHAARLEQPTRALVAACVAPQSSYPDMVKEPLGSLLIDRVRVVVQQNMASPDFGPERLARLMAMSRSKLYRLFEQNGGVAHFINRERLNEAHHRLSSQRETLSIQAIGNEVGFVDHSTFSRAFRREFGYSPTEARERGVIQSFADAPAERVRAGPWRAAAF